MTGLCQVLLASYTAFIFISALLIAEVASVPQNDIPSDGFSSCLILKDDNDRLPEWLAYHWLVLPLKYLVVAIDPNGTTSPEKIIHQWNTLDTGMEIVLWNDVDYNHSINEDLDEKHQHRQRQKHFLAKCMMYHKDRNRSWVAIIDPDEYITYNTIVSDDPHPYRKQDHPDTFSKGFEEYPRFDETEYRNAMYAMREKAAESLGISQTLFDFINEAKDIEPWISEICHLMPRLFFSAVESHRHELTEAHVEQFGFDVMNFSTLRYFKHASKDGWSDNHYGKVIVDISRIKSDQITKDMNTIHQPIPSACTYPFRPYETGIFRVNHYIGSWKAYSGKSDPRRSKERFEMFSSVNEGSDYQLQSWLGKFVEKIGVSNSKKLLEHSGLVDIGSVRLIDMDGYQRVETNEESAYYYGIN